MTLSECILLIKAVDHRVNYLHRVLRGNLTAARRKELNDEMNEILPLQDKLNSFKLKFKLNGNG